MNIVQATRQTNAIYNGNRTKCSPIRFFNHTSSDQLSGVPICLIMSMITDRIRRHLGPFQTPLHSCAEPN